MSSKKNNTSGFDLSVFNEKTVSELPDKITWPYLVALWRACGAYPVNDIQKRADEDETEYPKLKVVGTNQAKVLFAQASKIYVQRDPLRDVIDAARRDGEVIISNTSLVSKKQTYTMKNGYIEDLTGVEASIRQVCDIIITYTAWNQKSRAYVNTFNKTMCDALHIPYLNLIDVRASTKIALSDYVAARAELYNKLTDKDQLPFMWFKYMQDILEQTSMEPFRTRASKQVVQWYEKETRLMPDMRYTNYYVFKSTKLTMYSFPLVQIWKYSLTSDAARGGTKRRGIFSNGYYTFPVGPGYAKLGELRDVLSVLQYAKLNIIELINVNHELANYLAYNGIMVICKAMSDVHCNEHKKGIYGGSTIGRPLYRELPVMPNLDKNSVKFSPEPNFEAYEIRSLYLTPSLRFCVLHPSCRVSQGVVMGIYDPTLMTKPTESQMKEFNDNKKKLEKRFCNAVTWRNNYLFTRVPYCVRDPFRDMFVNYRLPPMKEDNSLVFQEEDDHDVAGMAVLEAIPDDFGVLSKLLVVEKVYKPITVSDEAIAYISEMLQEPKLPRVHYILHGALTGTTKLAPPRLYVYIESRRQYMTEVLHLIDNHLTGRKEGPAGVYYSYAKYGDKGVPPDTKLVIEPFVLVPDLEPEEVYVEDRVILPDGDSSDDESPPEGKGKKDHDEEADDGPNLDDLNLDQNVESGSDTEEEEVKAKGKKK